MTGTRTARRSRLALVGTPAAIERLDALRSAHEARGKVIDVSVDTLPTAGALREVAADADGVLVVGPRRRAPRTVVPGPVLEAGDGRLVPVGWLPDTGPEDLERFGATVAAVRARTGTNRTVAVLAQRSRRYRDLADRIIRHLGDDVHAPQVRRWTAEDVTRDALLAGLGIGLGAAIYVGHGRPIGWVGYRGVRPHHFEDVARPTGVVLSLTCLTASRRRAGLSFAEALPLAGAAAACFGAVRPTDHRENSRWALRLARELAARPGLTLGELVTAAYVETPTSLGYRILGDPLAPIVDDAGAAAGLERFAGEFTSPIDVDPQVARGGSQKGPAGGSRPPVRQSRGGSGGPAVQARRRDGTAGGRFADPQSMLEGEGGSRSCKR